jgi:hypothetical protein
MWTQVSFSAVLRSKNIVNEVTEEQNQCHRRKIILVILIGNFGFIRSLELSLQSFYKVMPASKRINLLSIEYWNCHIPCPCPICKDNQSSISLSPITHSIELELGKLFGADFRHKKPPKKTSEFSEHKRSVASIFRFKAIYKGKWAIFWPKSLNRPPRLSRSALKVSLGGVGVVVVVRLSALRSKLELRFSWAVTTVNILGGSGRGGGGGLGESYF